MNGVHYDCNGGVCIPVVRVEVNGALRMLGHPNTVMIAWIMFDLRYNHQ